MNKVPGFDSEIEFGTLTMEVAGSSLTYFKHALKCGKGKLRAEDPKRMEYSPKRSNLAGNTASGLFITT
jgi:hypothetical protein